MFRILYSVNPKNEQSMFTVSPAAARAKALAAMVLLESKAEEIASGIDTEKAQALFISTQTLSQNYPLFASSLFNLIKNAENHLDK